MAQFDLFAPPPADLTDINEPEARDESAAPHPALDRLRAIDPNEVRPRDALDLLYELHELASHAPDASR